MSACNRRNSNINLAVDEMDSSSSDEDFLSSIKRIDKPSGKDNSDQGEPLSSNKSDEEESINGNSSADDEGSNTGACAGSSHKEIEKERDLSSQSDNEESDNGEHYVPENKKRKRSLDSNDDQVPYENKSSNSESSDAECTKEEEKKIKDSNKRQKSNERQAGDSAKVVRLKKYLKVAGIRVQNYTKFFEGCKSKKAKEQKLLQLLESKGLKGKPTVEKCKKLCKKIEREREVAELDLGNIIDVNGNKSARIRTTRNRMKSLETEPKKDSDSHKKERGIFGNLHGIIDSEESENEYSNKETEQRKKRPKLIESDEES